MATSHTVNYAINDTSLNRGIQTLRHSRDIIPGEPVHVGRERQLLMDRHVVDDLNGCHRTVHQPVKHPANPVVKGEMPYEDAGPYSFGTILRDPQTRAFRLWAPVGDKTMRKQQGKVLGTKRAHYYESEDGLAWTRPELGVCEYDGSTANNIFLDKYLIDNLSVVPLPQRMHKRGRFAVLYCANRTSGQLEDPDTFHGNCHHVAFSDDGIHWTDVEENPVLCGRSDTNNCVVYNPDRDVFMMYRRATVNAGEVRRIAYCESADLLSWTQPINLFGHDELDPTYLYGMAVSRYCGVYLGMLLCLHVHLDWENQTLPGGKDFTMDTELTWSRDGANWQRHSLRPTFIPTSPQREGACDWGMAQGMANIMETDDEVRIYYGGRAYLHSPGPHAPDDPFRSGICLATLRRDGFVSIDPGPQGGYMLTRPLACPGGRLRINARTERDGFVRVAVREGSGVRDGEWPDAWRFEKSVPFSGDSLDHAMTWESGQSLASFPSDVIRLQFWMEKAELYSFRFE